MSEKGQGEDPATGTATGVDDGTTAAPAAEGSGSQADQTGPAGDQATEAIQVGGEVGVETDPDAPAEVPEPFEPQGPPQETDAERATRQVEEQAQRDEQQRKRDEAYSRAMEARDRRRAEEEGPPIEPPDLDSDESPAEPTTGSYLDEDDEKPVLS
jgi:hypothetical protein